MSGWCVVIVRCASSFLRDDQSLRQGLLIEDPLGQTWGPLKADLALRDCSLADKIFRRYVFEKKPKYPAPSAPEVENSCLRRQRTTEGTA